MANADIGAFLEQQLKQSQSVIAAQAAEDERRRKDAAGEKVQTGTDANGNPTYTQRVAGGAFGLGSTVTHGVGLNTEAYGSEAYDPIRQKALQQEMLNDVRAKEKININASTTKGAQIATGPQDQSRGMQMELGNDLLAASRGQGPSVAGMQYKQNMDDAMAQQFAMAASGRGNPGVALQQAAQNQASIAQRGAMDSAMIRAQEQQQAQGALAGLSTGMRGQDQNIATSQAGLDQQTGMFNAGQIQTAATDSAKLTQANEQFYRTMQAQFVAAGMTAEQAAIAAKQRLSELGADLEIRQEGMRQGLNMQATQNATSFGNTIIGGVIGGVGSAVGAAIGKP